MTEIDTYRPRTDIVAVEPNDAVNSLMDWAKSANAAREIAGHLVRTSFVPEGFRGKPDEATAAILAGIEVGLQPMAALRSFDVIQGTAAPRANTLRAIVQSQGHEVWLVESTDTRAIVAGRRRGSEQEQRSVWTIDRASKLNLTGKTNWRNQPQAMLVARATSEICRLIASDAILGLPYSIEELVDGSDSIDGQTTVTTTAKRRTAKRASAKPAAEAVTRGPVEPAPAEPEPVDAPPLPGDEEPVEAEVVEPPEDSATTKQLQAIAAALSFLSITEREDRLQVCAALAGRDDVATSKDLTKSDASHVLDLIKRISALDDPEAALTKLVGLGEVSREVIESTLSDLEAAS